MVPSALMMEKSVLMGLLDVGGSRQLMWGSFGPGSFDDKEKCLHGLVGCWRIKTIDVR